MLVGCAAKPPNMSYSRRSFYASNMNPRHPADLHSQHELGNIKQSGADRVSCQFTRRHAILIHVSLLASEPAVRYTIADTEKPDLAKAFAMRL